MKLLDKYIAKNFLVGYGIAFAVLVGLRVMIDLFMNIDEFAEHHSDIGFYRVSKNIISYYLMHSSLYFRDFAGMITVVAAVFSLGRLVRCGELIAVMASGVSLKRLMVPIVVLSLVFTGVLIIDQEMIIPTLAPRLVRSHDDLPGQITYDVDFIIDSKGSVLCAQGFSDKDNRISYPTIFTRARKQNSIDWVVTGVIDAKSAVYNKDTKRWELEEGIYAEKNISKVPVPIQYWDTDVEPDDIPIRQRASNITLLSFADISALASTGTNLRDVKQLYSQKHFRITDPIINLVMLMISLPLLICRDPRSMKSAIMTSFSITLSCYLITFACKLMAAETFFNIMPEVWAWLPIVIFLPIAVVEVDSMKT